MLNRFIAIKGERRQALAAFTKAKYGLRLEADTVFDVRIKRMHGISGSSSIFWRFWSSILRLEEAP